MSHAVKDFKSMVKAKIEALLTGDSVTVYDGWTPSHEHGIHAVVQHMLVSADGQMLNAGYQDDLTVTLYYTPDSADEQDNLDDLADTLKRGLHAHSEENETYKWHWQYTEFIQRFPVDVSNSRQRAIVLEFQLSAKEL